MTDERKVILILAGIFIIILMVNWFKPVDDGHTVSLKLLRTESVEAHFPEDILAIDSNLVRPILYSQVDFLDSLRSTVEAKQKFIDALLPAILIVKWQLKQDMERLEVMLEKGIQDQGDSTLVLNWFEQYKTDDLKVLKRRMITHPNSIVLAQAAVESGWGKSRFFKEANNVFGVWSFNPNEPRLAAGIKREDYQVYLRRYDHIAESVMDYFKTIARTSAYADFRRKRAETSNIRELLPYLNRYSERGDEYIAQLLAMIRYNDFEQYDTYEIDPAYVISE